jgi:hypothetical protein
LLSVVLHELGHVAGLDDLVSPVGGLMNRNLQTGSRLAPTPLEADAVLGNAWNWELDVDSLLQRK